MAFRIGAEFNKEPSGEALKDSALSPVSSVAIKQQDENSDFNISCPAILEPSEDDPFFMTEKIKTPLKTYKAIMKSYNSTDVLVNSAEPSNNGKCERKTGRRLSVWVDLFNHYKNFSVKFRNSNLIYVLQILLTLIPFSAIIMGNTFTKDCPGSPNLVNLTVLTGMFGVLLTGQWIVIGCCPPADRPCEGQQKYGILFFFILVSVLLELEIYLFSKLSPSFEPSAPNYCRKLFYDYTYYKFIAAFGSMLLVVLLYFPSYRSLASGVICSDPLTASCYRGMMEEEE